MNKEFVPYEPSLDLKELGFDEPCFGFYLSKTLRLDGKIDYCSSQGKIKYVYEGECLAPTFSQAFKWFREKHFLHSHITCSCTVNEILSYDWTIHKVMNNGTREENFITDYERTYEDAELECLKKLIEIVRLTKS